MVFNIDGHQVPQQTVIEVGDTFKRILEEVNLFTLQHIAFGVFGHECNHDYLNLESNGFLVTTDRESEG